MCGHEAPQGVRGHRLQVFGRPGLGRHESGGQPVSSDTDPHVAEVVVGRTTFPHATRPGHINQCSRVGMTPFQRGALTIAGFFGVIAQSGEIAEEILAFLVEFGRGLARFAAGAHEHSCH